MSRRTSPPFRADHVGSLLRPQRLLRAREDFAAGRIPAEELRAIEDAGDPRRGRGCRRRSGLQSATDGEFRRASWHMDFIYAARRSVQDPGEPVGAVPQRRRGHRVHAGGAPRGRQAQARRHDLRRRLHVPEVPRHHGGAQAHDPVAEHGALPRRPRRDRPGRLPGHGAVLGRPGRGLRRRGGPARRAGLHLPAARRHQPRLPERPVAARRDRRARRGRRAQHLRYIRQINAALATGPPGMAITTHMCRGNFRSSWVAEGGYDFVAEALFSELDVDGFFLEYDDERSGGFEPLRFVPKGKMVVLGLVTTKRAELESKDDLKRRIDEAAKFVPLDQLCLSPQCGFSSTVEGNALTYDEQVAKLAPRSSRPPGGLGLAPLLLGPRLTLFAVRWRAVSARPRRRAVPPAGCTPAPARPARGRSRPREPRRSAPPRGSRRRRARPAAAGDPQRPADQHGDQQRERGLPGDDRPDLPAGHADRLEQG